MTDYNISLTQWVDFQLPITVRNPAVPPATVGTPIDLTGATAKGSIFKGYQAFNRPAFEFEFNPDRSTGELTALFSANKAGLLAYGLYLYQIKIIDSLGAVLLLLEGVAEVKPGVPSA